MVHSLMSPKIATIGTPRIILPGSPYAQSDADAEIAQHQSIADQMSQAECSSPFRKGPEHKLKYQTTFSLE